MSRERSGGVAHRATHGCDGGSQFNALLPWELTDLIIDHGQYHGHRAWSLVCKSTLPRARSHLFRRMRIHTENECTEIIAGLRVGSTILRYVQELSVTNVLTWDPECLPVLLDGMPQLRALIIDGFYLPPGQNEVPDPLTRALSRCNHLRHVGLLQSHFPCSIQLFSDLVAAIPLLSSLSFEDCSFDQQEELVRSPPVLTIQKLNVEPCAFSFKPYWLDLALRLNCLTYLTFHFCDISLAVNVSFLQRLAHTHSESLRCVRLEAVPHAPNSLRDLIPSLRRIQSLEKLHIDLDVVSFGASRWPVDALEFLTEVGLSNVDLEFQANMTDLHSLKRTLASTAQMQALLGCETKMTVNLKLFVLESLLRDKETTLESVFDTAGYHLVASLNWGPGGDSRSVCQYVMSGKEVVYQVQKIYNSASHECYIDMLLGHVNTVI